MNIEEIIKEGRKFFEILFKKTGPGSGKVVKIPYSNLINHNLEFSDLIEKEPDDFIKTMEIAYTEEFHDKKDPEIRITELPESMSLGIGYIRKQHIGNFKRFDGLVVRTGDIQVTPDVMKFECPQCGNIITIIQPDDSDEVVTPTRCGCGRKGKFILRSRTWKNVRYIMVEEYIEDYTDKKARPTVIRVTLEEGLTKESLTKKLQPGKHVIINGEVKVKQIGKTKHFEFRIKANHVVVEDISLFNLKIPAKYIPEFKEMKNSPDVIKDIASSIFYQIEGQGTLKEILAISRARGVKTYHEDGSLDQRDTINVFMVGDPGAAKCFAKETGILMYDGSIRNIENIIIGDKVMGDDSTERVVESVSNGCELMYSIVPVKGDKYIVNKSHILSLIGSKKNHKYGNDKIDINLKDYVNLDKSTREVLKGYRKGVIFRKKNIEIDPYFLGIWLGDGRSITQEICNSESEVQDYIYKYAKFLGLRVSKYIDKRNPNSNGYSIVSNNGKNHLRRWLKSYNLIKNKHIPQDYKINNAKVRLELLAGLIDSDGTLSHNVFSITQKNRLLSNDILFLARSLGFAAYKSKMIIQNVVYYRISISGDTYLIPTKVKRKKANKRKQIKNVLHTGIKVVSEGEGIYFGFTIKGEKRRFLLSDFTVVHNTECAKAAVKVDPIHMTVSGKGVSGAGLSSTTTFDKELGCWQCLPGAVPRCNHGSIVIDEIDKIDDKDTSSLNEGMTNLEFMTAKAGQQISLPMDVGIIGCANPDGRKFDLYTEKYRQITLKPDFLDRFDIWIAVEKDVETEKQKKVIKKIISRFNIEGDKGKAKYNLKFIQYYYAWVIQNFKPIITEEISEYAEREISKLMNKAGSDEKSREISYRLVGNIIRFGLAIAKLKQCEKVEEDHISMAIMYQKYGFATLDMIDEKTGVVSEESIQLEVPQAIKRKKYNIIDILNELYEEKKAPVSTEEIELKWEEEGHEKKEVYDLMLKLARAGDAFEPTPNFWRPI